MDDKELFAMILSKHIRSRRLQLDLTLDQLSSMTGVDDKHLGKIELRKKLPNSHTLGKIIVALDLNLNAVLNEIVQAENGKKNSLLSYIKPPYEK